MTGLAERRCPYCQCGFAPATSEQIYCSPFCEIAAQKDDEQRGGEAA